MSKSLIQHLQEDEDSEDSSESEGSEDLNFDDYYESLEASEVENFSINACLEDDIARVQQYYGKDAIKHRLFERLDSVDVELFIPLDFLDHETASAWKIVLHEPKLAFQLQFSASCYLNGPKPKINILQLPGKNVKHGIANQTKKILEAFIDSTWGSLSNEKVSSVAHRPTVGKDQPSKSPDRTSGSDSDSNRAPGTSVQDASGGGFPKDYASALDQLCGMGFPLEKAKIALVESAGDMQEALNHILTEDDKKTSPLPKLLSWFQNPNPRNSAKKLKRTNPETSTKSAKEVPPLECGFLVQLIRYMYQRLPTLNEFCVVCDERHIFELEGMLKPTVCARELCVFAFQTLGVMSDAADDIASGPQVVQMLIAMAMAACLSGRRDAIFDPYPSVVDPRNPSTMSISPSKKEFTKVSQLLEILSHIAQLAQLGNGDLKKELDHRDSLAYPLLQWLINSNRSHIIKLPKEKHLRCMNTGHQFILMSDSPAKERQFREARKKHGSTFAFHGSSIENWHRILRVGLINASGTKYQMHGAAHGPGIYLSPRAEMSFGYSMARQRNFYPSPPKAHRTLPQVQTPPHVLAHQMLRPRLMRPQQHNQHQNKPKQMPQPSNPGFEAGSDRAFMLTGQRNLYCIALCEVIKSGELKQNDTIWVMANPDHVCTRFFFLYEENRPAPVSNVISTKPEVIADIKKAMSMCLK